MRKLLQLTAIIISLTLLVSCTVGISRETDKDVATAAPSETTVRETVKEDTMPDITENTEDDGDLYSDMSEEEAKDATLTFIIATSALHMYCNNWEYSDFGRGDPDDISDLADSLKKNYYVSDKSTAALNVEWLVREGLKYEFIYVCRDLEKNGVSGTEQALKNYLTAIYGDEAGPATAKAYLTYLEKGEHAIDGYDYSRAVTCLQWYVYAEIYTRDEALEAAFEIAKRVQKEFKSWDEYIDSYIAGSEFFYYRDMDERREMYEEIKASDFNPYEVPWNTPLTRSWDETEIPVSQNGVSEEFGSWEIPEGWCKLRYESSDVAACYCLCDDVLNMDDHDLFFVSQNNTVYEKGKEDQFEEFMHTLYTSGYFYDFLELRSESKGVTSHGDPMFTYVLYDAESDFEYSEIYVLGDCEYICFSGHNNSGDGTVYDVIRQAADSFIWENGSGAQPL